MLTFSTLLSSPDPHRAPDALIEQHAKSQSHANRNAQTDAQASETEPMTRIIFSTRPTHQKRAPKTQNKRMPAKKRPPHSRKKRPPDEAPSSAAVRRRCGGGGGGGGGLDVVAAKEGGSRAVHRSRCPRREGVRGGNTASSLADSAHQQLTNLTKRQATRAPHLEPRPHARGLE